MIWSVSDWLVTGDPLHSLHGTADLAIANDRRRSINIYSRRGAPVIAVNDGVVRKIGKSRKLGRFIVLQDVREPTPST